VGLTASAGISVNKFVAKIASDYNKPNGQKTVNPDDVLSFLEELPIRKFYGVGKVTTEKMYQLGIFTGLELKSKSIDFLSTHFGKSGSFYYNVVRGIHNSEVKSDRITKSVAAEHTFEINLTSEVFMMEQLERIASSLTKRVHKNQVAGKTVTLKIKYSDFTQQTRSKTLPYFISDKGMILETVTELLYQESLKDSVRLLGISLSNLNTESKKNVMVQLKFDF
jgi:DNA polymerase-4